MDTILRNIITQDENVKLTSLEELYVDFDQWIVKMSQFCSKRSREANSEETVTRSLINEEKLKLHEFLFHGIFIEKTPLKHFDVKLKITCNDNDNFVSNDYVILGLMKKSKYMKSKL